MVSSSSSSLIRWSRGAAATTAAWDDMNESRWGEHLERLRKDKFGGWECDMCMGFNEPSLDVCALCCR